MARGSKQELYFLLS